MAIQTAVPRLGSPPRWLEWTLPRDQSSRALARQYALRILIATNLVLGGYYITWRWTSSINWEFWPIALLLIVAETYSYLDGWLFGLTMWRWRWRPPPPPPRGDETVDVFITCYNEPVELVRETVQAAMRIRHPHTTWVLDDGSSEAMRRMASEEGAGYIVRSSDWANRSRHAKAGNLNNALFRTTGEFVVVLDADQIPAPDFLDKTLGYFEDPRMAFVQTPQWFYNVPLDDPFGTQAPLFYGPIQQGKDGWNAAFFCGSNAVLRREALMQLGVRRYVVELEQRVNRALRAADRLLERAAAESTAVDAQRLGVAVEMLRTVVRDARARLRQDEPIQTVTWEFQREVENVARLLVLGDLVQIQQDLADIPGLEAGDLATTIEDVLSNEAAVEALSGRATSPLAAIAAVRGLLLAVDVDRDDEAQPIMPMATISVTEDMATAMRMHSVGWRSAYHDEVLCRGLAPEDLRSSLQQRLRWAQGTMQVMLRENPLIQRGLSTGQRIQYFATMWSYLSGFPTVVFLLAPVLYLLLGIMPVKAYSDEFFVHLLPFLIVNQLLFLVVGWRLPTARGMQYSLALFPLWIKAVWTAAMNVYAGQKLGFVVTPKTRQGGSAQLQLVTWQLVVMGLLILSAVYGLARLALGYVEDGFPILVNVFWIGYDLYMLSAVLDAAFYRAPDDATVVAVSDAHGRM